MDHFLRHNYTLLICAVLPDLWHGPELRSARKCPAAGNETNELIVSKIWLIVRSAARGLSAANDSREARGEPCYLSKLCSGISGRMYGSRKVLSLSGVTSQIFRSLKYANSLAFCCGSTSRAHNTFALSISAPLYTHSS